jgi:hypothetical protein
MGGLEMTRILGPRVCAVVFALLGVACGNGTGSNNGLTEDDAGMVVPGDCTAEMGDALRTVGCNGFAGDPVPNGALGPCEVGTDEMPSGSCTDVMGTCMGNEDGSPGGWCAVLCTPPESYIAQSDCPTGFRCFRIGAGDDAFGQCYRDCDGAHACPAGWNCGPEGRCERPPLM